MSLGGISVSEPSGSVFLLTCGSRDSISSCKNLGRGHRSRAPVKLCIGAFKSENLYCGDTELAGIDYAPLVLLCIRVIRLGVFAHLWSIILYQIFIYYRSGHRGRTPVKLCIQHSNLKFVMQGCRACWI